MSAAAARASITHRGHGRTRLRFRGERGNPSFFEELNAKFSRLPGVVQIEMRPETGSMLVFHESSWTELEHEATEKRLFTISAEDSSASTIDLRAIAESLPAPLVAAGGLAALAALQVFRGGRVLPPAITLAWYGYELASRFLAESQKE